MQAFHLDANRPEVNNFLETSLFNKTEKILTADD